MLWPSLELFVIQWHGVDPARVGGQGSGDGVLAQIQAGGVRGDQGESGRGLPSSACAHRERSSRGGAVTLAGLRVVCDHDRKHRVRTGLAESVCLAAKAPVLVLVLVKSW